MDALRRQSFQKLNRRDAGQLVSVITTDVELIEVFYAHTIAPILITLLPAATFSLFLAQIAWPLAVAALLVYTALAYWLPQRLARGRQALSCEYRKQMGALSAFFLDTVRGLRDTRLQALKQHSQALNASFRRAKEHEAAVRGHTEALLAGSNLLILVLVLYLLAVGQIGFDGALAAVITLLASYGPFVALSNLSASLPQTLSATERVLALLVEPTAVEEIRNQTDLSEVKTLEADGVSFDYECQGGVAMMARRGAGRDEVEATAKMANIHDRIMALPQGYDTVVPEHGALFSDGEKQRLSLARAFLHNASVWLLDEPTSNLDSLNEALILQTLLQQKTDKIVILVSHRLSTLGICDRVLHLQQGRIAPCPPD
ncbi:MAG: ABC transporter ATP-binding protein [Neisseria sp.]|nr:ABC transporter ATP-binding protein [Neisseria sp.]